MKIMFDLDDASDVAKHLKAAADNDDRNPSDQVKFIVKQKLGVYKEYNPKSPAPKGRKDESADEPVTTNGTRAGSV